MSTAFVRQLGAESGVQLNPLVDGSEIPTSDNSDQVFGIVMRATRGRIDKPFKVNRSNVAIRLGAGEQMRDSELNEAYVHVVEALNNGAYEAVVQRLSTIYSRTHLACVTLPSSSASSQDPTWQDIAKWTGMEWDDPLFSGDGIVYIGDELPGVPYLLSVKHLDCFNDGIKISYHADELKNGGVQSPNSVITLRVLDRKDVVIYEFKGSLNRLERDDYGNSMYLPDIVSAQTDAVEVTVGTSGMDAVIMPNSSAYGYNSTGRENWLKSGLLMCFDEVSTDYTATDISEACVKMQATQHNYSYIASGGSKSPSILSRLAQLAFDTNRQMRFDVPGNLGVDAAIAFVEQMNLGSSQAAHLLHAFWSPFKSIDPTGLQGKEYFGTSTLNIAQSCLRNANTNALGFAPKNYPIAGREWPVNRRGITQVVTPTDQELNALARAKINPVVFEMYSGGGRTVFRDSLTMALVDSSLKKLISVADMSSTVDDAVTRYGKDCLQLPMQVGIKKFSDFLEQYFTNAEASGWLVPSADPLMNGKAWNFDVRPNAVRPYDRMDVTYALRYDGTVRQIIVTQTLTK